jgi:hypothetical protein
MRTLASIFVLVTSLAYADEDCAGAITCGHWTTERTYPHGTLLLNWTRVYEGQDTVFRIDFPTDSNGPKQLKVEGQPVFDSQSSVVALPYCADDGCAARVPFVSLLDRRDIGAAILPYQGQFYIDGRWQGDVFILRVSMPEGNGTKETTVTHRYLVTPDTVEEQR